jgi:hypothetical protein
MPFNTEGTERFTEIAERFTEIAERKSLAVPLWLFSVFSVINRSFH